MTTLLCSCELQSVEWVTDTTEFEFDGEYDLQPGTCPCGKMYYRQYAVQNIVSADGQLI